MPQLAGKTVPPVLLKRWRSAASRAGEAIVLITVDDRGRIHTALLAPVLVVPIDPGSFLLTVAHGSRTARHLRSGRPASLHVADSEGVWTLQGVASVARPALRSVPPLGAFRFEIRRVLSDHPPPAEKGARIVSGIRFVAPAPLRAIWRAVRRELVVLAEEDPAVPKKVRRTIR